MRMVFRGEAQEKKEGEKVLGNSMGYMMGDGWWRGGE